MTIYEEIKNNIDINKLNELEISRLLYIELGSRVCFSTKYQNTDIASMNKLLTTQVNINTFNEQQVNCAMWAQLYSQLLTAYGIQNRIIDSGHQFVEFIALGKKWVADATDGAYTDLSRIHNSDNIECFGLSIYQNSNDKSHNRPMYNIEIDQMLKDIDKKIGYNDEKYKDLIELKEIINNIKNGTININNYVSDALSNNEVEKKLQFLFAKLGTLDSGYYEAKDYIYQLEKLLLTKEELENVSAVELKRTNKDGNVDILQVISVQCDNNYNYYILRPSMPIKQINKEDLEKLILLGYGIDENKEVKGINYNKIFKPGEKAGIKEKFTQYLNKDTVERLSEEYDQRVRR